MSATPATATERPLVIVADPLHPAGLERLASRFALAYLPEMTDEAARREALAAAEAIVAGAFRIDGDLLRAAPRLRLVATLGPGADEVDVPEATLRGVMVADTPGVGVGGGVGQDGRDVALAVAEIVETVFAEGQPATLLNPECIAARSD